MQTPSFLKMHMNSIEAKQLKYIDFEIKKGNSIPLPNP